MFVAKLKNLRTEIDGDLKDGLDRFVFDNKTTIRAVTESLLEWLLVQPQLVQLALLKGLELDDELRSIVAARLQSTSPRIGRRVEDRTGGAGCEETPATNPAPNIVETTRSGGKVSTSHRKT
jgi:hypothetical protein